MADEFPLKDYKKGEDEEWLDQHPGRPTGRITKPVECPVKWLMKLPGLRGEHKKLTLDMPKIKGMAESCVNDPKWRKEHPCELGVQWDGKIYVDDGNHRIRAAKLAKLDTYPCIIKFYGGGEDEVDIEDIISKHASQEPYNFTPKPQLEPEDYQAFDKFHGKQVDNPGPDWVANKVRLGEHKTSGWYKKPIMLPTDYVLGLKGQRGEHERLTLDHPAVLDKMERLQNGSNIFNPIHVVGYHKNEPTIYEGNHRVRAAKNLGMEYVPTQLVHMNGNEDYMHPLDIINQHELGKQSKKVESNMNINKLISEARRKIAAGESIADISNALLKLADEQGIGGATDVFGNPGDQEYDNMRETGEDEAGQNSPDKGQQRRFGPRGDATDAESNDMVQEANWNKIPLSEIRDTDAKELNRRLNHEVSWNPTMREHDPNHITPSDTKPENPAKFVGKNRDVRDMTPDMQDMTNHAETEIPPYESYTTQQLGGIAPVPMPKPTTRQKMTSLVSLNSSNKPCAKCGMPTDQCVCMSDKMPTDGNNPIKTNLGVDKRMDASVHQAELALKNEIKAHGKMTREASHMEEIEIPFKDLKLENDVNYHMSGFGAQQQVSMLVQRYLQAHVYPGRLRFTIARIEQDMNMNKMFVKVLVFDKQINHEGSAASDEKMVKNSSGTSGKLVKTAWKKRLTEVLGSNDKTGLVVCPVEGNFLTRSCGACPLAANAATYIEDGYVECNFDNMSDYLNNGKQVHEHKPYQR